MEIKTNPQIKSDFDKNWKPIYRFGGYDISEKDAEKIEGELHNAIIKRIPEKMIPFLFETKPSRNDIVNDIYDMLDRFTNVVCCHPNDYEWILERLGRESERYKLIKVPALEKGQVMLIRDENIKRTLLRAEREKNK